MAVDEFGVSASRQTRGRELRTIGFTKLSVRPQHHAQDPEAIEAFKENLPGVVAEIRTEQARGKIIEIWFQDEARVGQKNKLTDQPLRIITLGRRDWAHGF